MTTRTRSVADLEVIATMDKEIERLRRELSNATANAEHFRNAYQSAYEDGRAAIVSVNRLRSQLQPLRAELDATKSKLSCVEAARQMLDRRVAELMFSREQASRIAAENARLKNLLDAARELMQRPSTKKRAACKPRQRKKKKGTR